MITVREKEDEDELNKNGRVDKRTRWRKLTHAVYFTYSVRSWKRTLMQLSNQEGDGDSI